MGEHVRFDRKDEGGDDRCFHPPKPLRQHVRERHRHRSQDAVGGDSNGRTVSSTDRPEEDGISRRPPEREVGERRVRVAIRAQMPRELEIFRRIVVQVSPWVCEPIEQEEKSEEEGDPDYEK